jgi:hypothetical protein
MRGAANDAGCEEPAADGRSTLVASQLPARNDSNLVVALLLKYQSDMDADSLFT